VLSETDPTASRTWVPKEATSETVLETATSPGILEQGGEVSCRRAPEENAIGGLSGYSRVASLVTRRSSAWHGGLYSGLPNRFVLAKRRPRGHKQGAGTSHPGLLWGVTIGSNEGFRTQTGDAFASFMYSHRYFLPTSMPRSSEWSSRSSSNLARGHGGQPIVIIIIEVTSTTKRMRFMRHLLCMGV
jgi:hypothetical protein